MKPISTLSNREYEICEYVVTGWTDKEIANELFRAEKTIKNTKQNIYQKLEVKNVGELATWYYVTKYHIPLDLLPKTVRSLSIILLMIILPSQFAQATDMRSARSSRTTRVSRARRSGRRKSELQLIF